ncbi:MAG: DUF2806 domain-containing protein [Holophagaceae bacterium]|nr:DUF2806 domain-containing protein [Holophagaceae bacterium]
MPANLPATIKFASSAWGIVKAIGPFFITQSAKASEAYAQHQMRLIQVEACKELMIGEIQTMNEVRQKLMGKYYESPDEERFRIKRDLLDLERDIRRLGIYQKALEHLPKEEDSQPTPKPADTPVLEISSSWQDRFDEIARLQNEVWRQELLSRAMALEAQSPGTISPRALWFIGTVDDRIFHAFASLIDICPMIGGRYIIPNHQNFFERILPGCVLGADFRLGNATFQLNELGILGDLFTSARKFHVDAIIRAAYGTKFCTLKIKQEYPLNGILLTPLGDTIASLYDPTPNDLGLEIFSEWFKSINPEIAEIQQ